MKTFSIAIAAIFVLAMAQPAEAQTSTKNLTIDGGTGGVGSLGGNIDVIVKPQTDDASVQTAGTLTLNELDIRTEDDGGFLNTFPNDSSSLSSPISAAIGIDNTTVGIALNTANFNSPISGFVNITAGDTRADAIPGVLDGGVPGSDGAWDDPGKTGILNNATVNSFSMTLDNDIASTANVTGGLGFNVPSDITIPDVVDTTLIDADLRIKNTTEVDITFDPVQNIALQSFSIGSTNPVSVTNPTSNFIEANHPSGTPQLDLSVTQGASVLTTVSGVLSADLTGTVTGSIDLAADLTLAGFIPVTIDLDDAIDGVLAGPGVSILDLSEAIALPDVELPFLVNILHEPTADLDFDDVLAELRSGTFGFSFPVELNEEVVLTLPELDFQVQGLSEYVSVPTASGTIYVDNLEASVSGDIVLDIDADLLLNADLVASAFGANAINVVPEPTSASFLAVACLGFAGVRSRRRRS